MPEELHPDLANLEGFWDDTAEDVEAWRDMARLLDHCARGKPWPEVTVPTEDLIGMVCAGVSLIYRSLSLATMTRETAVEALKMLPPVIQGVAKDARWDLNELRRLAAREAYGL